MSTDHNRHNGGPPLDDDRPWGPGPIGNFHLWKRATDDAFENIPYAIKVRRALKAEACGLTYREYMLELLERGHYLQPYDVDRIAEIKRRRPL